MATLAVECVFAKMMQVDGSVLFIYLCPAFMIIPLSLQSAAITSLC